jgi:hypothetical protein
MDDLTEDYLESVAGSLKRNEATSIQNVEETARHLEK